MIVFQANITSFYKLTSPVIVPCIYTEKIAIFVKRSKDYPYKRQVFVYIFGCLTRVVTGWWYICGIVGKARRIH